MLRKYLIMLAVVIVTLLMLSTGLVWAKNADPILLFTYKRGGFHYPTTLNPKALPTGIADIEFSVYIGWWAGKNFNFAFYRKQAGYTRQPAVFTNPRFSCRNGKPVTPLGDYVHFYSGISHSTLWDIRKQSTIRKDCNVDNRLHIRITLTRPLRKNEQFLIEAGNREYAYSTDGKAVIQKPKEVWWCGFVAAAPRNPALPTKTAVTWASLKARH